MYTQGEMRTLKVCAGDTARAQPLLRGPSRPPSSSKVFSKKAQILFIEGLLKSNAFPGWWTCGPLVLIQAGATLQTKQV